MLLSRSGLLLSFTLEKVKGRERVGRRHKQTTCRLEERRRGGGMWVVERGAGDMSLGA